MDKSVSPNEYIYKYFTRISGPQSASANDFDLDTNSAAEDSVFAYSNNEKASHIARVNIEIMDSNIRYDRFAGVVSALTDGCLFRVVDANGGLRLDFLNGVPLLRNADFIVLAGKDIMSFAAAAGDDVLPIRFSIFKASEGLPLRLDKGDCLEWVNRDDLSSISVFRIMAQGKFE